MGESKQTSIKAYFSSCKSLPTKSPSLKRAKIIQADAIKGEERSDVGLCADASEAMAASLHGTASAGGAASNAFSQLKLEPIKVESSQEFVTVPRKQEKPSIMVPANLRVKKPHTSAPRAEAIKRRLNFSIAEPLDTAATNLAPMTSAKIVEPKVRSVEGRTVNFYSHVEEPGSSLLAKLSPSKVDPAEVRSRLGKASNLQELRKRLATFSETACRLNIQRKNDDIVLQKREENASPSKTANPLAQTAETAPTAEPPYIPIYERFKHLVSEEPELILPPSYRMLFDMFRGVDQLVAMLYNRQESVTFVKLKEGVQHMTKKNFEKRHLAQIKTVYPESYVVKQVAVTKYRRHVSPTIPSFELTIVPNIGSDLTTYGVTSPVKTVGGTSSLSPISSPLKRKVSSETVSPSASPVKSPEKGTESSKAHKLTGIRLLYRLEIFRQNLLQRVQKFHMAFLENLSPPVHLSEEDASKIRRWHPQFRLDRVEDIEAAELPEAPMHNRIYSVKELLVEYSGSLTPNVKTALAKITPVASAEKLADEERPEGSAKATKGIPEALLKKVRAKENLRKQNAMFRTPAAERRLRRIHRLPDFIRIIRNFFATEHKSSMPVNRVVQKLADSYGSLVSEEELRKNVDLLLEVVPDCVAKVSVKDKGDYIKLTGTVFDEALFEKLRTLANSSENIL